MLPETGFFSRRQLISVIAEGRYYGVGNSNNVNEDFLDLCGTRFPLVAGRTVSDEETAYMKKNKTAIQSFQTEIEDELKKGRGIENLTSELVLLRDIHYFLKEIVAGENPVARLRTYQKREIDLGRFTEQQTDMLSDILDDDFLVMNWRVYPLVRSTEPVFVRLGGKNYSIGKCRMKVEDVEKQFQDRMRSGIKSFLISKLDATREVEEEIAELKERIEILREDLFVKKNPFSYECGDIGFDTSLKAVYYLVEPHYNSTSNKSYGEGQCAVSLHFSNGNLGTGAIFVDRESRDKPFLIHPHSNCYGVTFSGSSMEDKLYYLYVCKKVVESNHRFYQEESSGGSEY